MAAGFACTLGPFDFVNNEMTGRRLLHCLSIGQHQQVVLVVSRAKTMSAESMHGTLFRSMSKRGTLTLPHKQCVLIPGTILHSASHSLLCRSCLLQAKLVAHWCPVQTCQWSAKSAVHSEKSLSRPGLGPESGWRNMLHKNNLHAHEPEQITGR